MSKPTTIGLLQIVWHFFEAIWHFFTSGLAFFVHLDLADPVRHCLQDRIISLLQVMHTAKYTKSNQATKLSY